MNKSGEKEGRRGKKQRKDGKSVKVNKARGNDNKISEDEKAGKQEEVSKKFPNFSLLTEEEKLVFFEALTTARKNVEKRGVPTRQRFGTIHDEYLNHFEQDVKSEQLNEGINPVLCGSTTTWDVVSLCCNESTTFLPQGGDPSEKKFVDYKLKSSSTFCFERIPETAKPKVLDECESVIEQNTNKIINLYVKKKKKTEVKPQTQRTESKGKAKKEKGNEIKESCRAGFGLEKISKGRPNTPQFDALSTEEKGIFFRILNEARNNVVERNSEKKNKILPLNSIMKLYQGSEESTNVLGASEKSQKREKGKFLNLKVTVTSGDGKKPMKGKKEEKKSEGWTEGLEDGKNQLKLKLLTENKKSEISLGVEEEKTLGNVKELTEEKFSLAETSEKKGVNKKKKSNPLREFEKEEILQKAVSSMISDKKEEKRSEKVTECEKEKEKESNEETFSLREMQKNKKKVNEGKKETSDENIYRTEMNETVKEILSFTQIQKEKEKKEETNKENFRSRGEEDDKMKVVEIRKENSFLKEAEKDKQKEEKTKGENLSSEGKGEDSKENLSLRETRKSQKEEEKELNVENLCLSETKENQQEEKEKELSKENSSLSQKEEEEEEEEKEINEENLSLRETEESQETQKPREESETSNCQTPQRTEASEESGRTSEEKHRSCSEEEIKLEEQEKNEECPPSDKSTENMTKVPSRESQCSLQKKREDNTRPENSSTFTCANGVVSWDRGSPSLSTRELQETDIETITEEGHDEGKTEEGATASASPKVMFVEGNVIDKIRNLIYYLEEKARKDDRLEKEYIKLLVDYVEYLSRVLEALVLKKKHTEVPLRIQKTFVDAGVHLKFDEGLQTKDKDKKETSNKFVPRSVSAQDIPGNVFVDVSLQKMEDKPTVADSEITMVLTDSDTSLNSEENHFAPFSAGNKVITTKIRLLQDLLKQRAEFVEGSAEDFKIIHHPEKDYVPVEKPQRMKSIIEEKEESARLERNKFFKFLCMCFTCGKKKEDNQGIFENLKGEAVRVDVSEGKNKDPANATLNQSVMEVLKAAGRKKIIEKYYNKS